MAGAEAADAAAAAECSTVDAAELVVSPVHEDKAPPLKSSHLLSGNESSCSSTIPKPCIPVADCPYKSWK